MTRRLRGRSTATGALLAISLALVLAACVTVVGSCATSTAPPVTNRGGPTSGGVPDDSVFAQAFAARATDLAVEGRGTVYRLLPDDNDGSRHQRFLLELASGHTLLVAHNIDVAPRVESLDVGDTIAFKGVYEWNEQGGVIHWTHHDPAGLHESGWIQHEGRTYR